MAFKVFTGAGKRIGKAVVSIWQRGQIGLNQGAMKRFKLEGFKYVVLLFDDDTRIVGMQFTNDADREGALKITNRATGISFSGAAFLNTFGIDFGKKTIQYALEYDENNQLHVFDTNKPLESEGKRKVR